MKKVHDAFIGTMLPDWDEEKDRPLLELVNRIFQSSMDISIRGAFERAKDDVGYLEQERLDQMLVNAMPGIPMQRPPSPENN
jgi:hypothetical protein